MDLETLVRRDGPLPAGAGGPHPAPGLRVARGGARRGLVHRDIKPANIHLGRVGLRARLRQGARLRAGEVGERHRVTIRWPTAAGITPGTPAYMAPEMALGGAGGRPGRPLLAGLRRLLPAHRAARVRGRHRHPDDRQAHPAAAGAALAATEQPIPPALEAIVLACLAKEPAQRPQTAAALAADLAAVEERPAPYSSTSTLNPP